MSRSCTGGGDCGADGSFQAGSLVRNGAVCPAVPGFCRSACRELAASGAWAIGTRVGSGTGGSLADACGGAAGAASSGCCAGPPGPPFPRLALRPRLEAGGSHRVPDGSFAACAAVGVMDARFAGPTEGVSFDVDPPARADSAIADRLRLAPAFAHGWLAGLAEGVVKAGGSGIAGSAGAGGVTVPRSTTANVVMRTAFRRRFIPSAIPSLSSLASADL